MLSLCYMLNMVLQKKRANAHTIAVTHEHIQILPPSVQHGHNVPTDSRSQSARTNKACVAIHGFQETLRSLK